MQEHPISDIFLSNQYKQESMSPNLINVVAAVIQKNDIYLLCQRPLHKGHGCLWEFPGGKIENNETFFTAAQRELREELAVEVLQVEETLFSRQDEGSHFVIRFCPVKIIGDPRPTEHQQVDWVAKSELLSDITHR